MHGSSDDQQRIWLLAGTGEGPKLAKTLVEQGWRVSVSVVTASASHAYSGLSLEDLMVGPLAGAAGIKAVLRRHRGFDWVVDVTHPFATRISDQLRQACADCDQPLLRLARPNESGQPVHVLTDLVELQRQSLQGNRVLLAIGARHLALAASAARAAGAEIFARVLPSSEGLRCALAVGLPTDQLAVLRPLQGDRPGHIERALCRRWQITDVVCRQSGGVIERLWRTIAREQGLCLWLVRRPDGPDGVETVVGVQALLQRLDHGRSPFHDFGSHVGGR
ncbi:MAG: precorrin-6A reductase [Cyanobium sp. NAT70]|nr:precorrin-6A reductase [Cyanobium sp. NAT70]|tara:strand:+ start:597 stop:1430 length:834 start_codon:yes stop_codon:yes gene_type:complete